MAKVKTKVSESCTFSAGTVMILTGASALGFFTFSQRYTDGEFAPYVLEHANGTDWERGYGKVDNSGTTFDRLFVYESTNGDLPLANLATGTHLIFVAPFVDADSFSGYIVSDNAGGQSLSVGSAVYLNFDTIVDDPFGLLTGLMPTNVFPIPAWVSRVKIIAQLGLAGMANPLEIRMQVTNGLNQTSSPTPRIRRHIVEQNHISVPSIHLPTYWYNPHFGGNSQLKLEVVAYENSHSNSNPTWMQVEMK